MPRPGARHPDTHPANRTGLDGALSKSQPKILPLEIKPLAQSRSGSRRGQGRWPGPSSLPHAGCVRPRGVAHWGGRRLGIHWLKSSAEKRFYRVSLKVVFSFSFCFRI